MSRNEIMITAVGWAASKPREIGDGVPFTSFRLASTPRFYDSRQGAWVDGRTEWMTVKVFRDVALNVAGSITKGDPVIVHGRLCTEEWQGDGGTRTGMVVEAAALGHDLTRGRGTFVRVLRGGRAAGAADEAADAAEPGGVADSPEAAADDDPWAVEEAVEAVAEVEMVPTP